MAGKSKSVYLTVTPKGKLMSVFRKVFFDAKSFNDYVKTEEFKQKYPKEEYEILKEIYWKFDNKSFWVYNTSID